MQERVRQEAISHNYSKEEAGHWRHGGMLLGFLDTIFPEFPIKGKGYQHFIMAASTELKLRSLSLIFYFFCPPSFQRVQAIVLPSNSSSNTSFRQQQQDVLRWSTTTSLLTFYFCFHLFLCHIPSQLHITTAAEHV